MYPVIDERWAGFGITPEFLETKAEWLREPRLLHGGCVRFFELASTLILHSRYDYPLGSLAFFQAVIGVERALKLHYRSEKKHLASLFSCALKDALIHDILFADSPSPSARFLRQVPGRYATYSERLAVLVPELRNQFFHGTYLLAPEYVHLAIQLRKIADVLDTKKG